MSNDLCGNVAIWHFEIEKSKLKSVRISRQITSTDQYLNKQKTSTKDRQTTHSNCLE
jgi:hypothetical protein